LGIIIIPTDELIFFRGVGQPPTSNPYELGIIIPTDELIFFRGLQTTNQVMIINWEWILMEL